MELRYTKATITAVWVLIVIVAASIGNLAPMSKWVILAVLTAIPPTILWQLWNVPAPSLSESGHKAMKG